MIHFPSRERMVTVEGAAMFAWLWIPGFGSEARGRGRTNLVRYGIALLAIYRWIRSPNGYPQ